MVEHYTLNHIWLDQAGDPGQERGKVPAAAHQWEAVLQVTVLPNWHFLTQMKKVEAGLSHKRLPCSATGIAFGPADVRHTHDTLNVLTIINRRRILFGALC